MANPYDSSAKVQSVYGIYDLTVFSYYQGGCILVSHLTGCFDLAVF